MGGGWGSFTAAVLTFRDGFGKSYGTIGYESSTNTSYSAMGAAYNPKFFCTSAAVAGSCTAPYGSATVSSAGTAGTPVANATMLYVAISLWSAGSDATTFNFTKECTTTSAANVSCLQLTWVKGTWSTTMSGLTAPASMAAAAAADFERYCRC